MAIDLNELMLSRAVQPDTGGRGILGILRDCNMRGAATSGFPEQKILNNGFCGMGRQGVPGIFAKLGLSPKDILADLAKFGGNQNLQALQQSMVSLSPATNVSPSAAPTSSVVMADMGNSLGASVG